MYKSKLYYGVSILVATVLIMGCSGSNKVKPSINKNRKVEKVQPPIQASRNSTLTIADLKNAGFGSIVLSGKKEYRTNQPIQFRVNTRGKTGYLYIIYVDNNNKTTILYPNASSPLTELNGKYFFPKDFGGMNITATKDCKDCKEERTVVYAILSKKPISDINNITADDLRGTKMVASKAISMSLPSSSKADIDISVAQIEFAVK